jgi:Zn-dependent protease
LSQQVILERVMFLIPLVLSLTIHEFSHAWSAYLLGDDTAALQGRMTLNPIVHMDPIGTFLLPLVGVPFGWAKPVPVNPARFRRSVSMGTGMMITALAGPASNLVLALLCAVTSGVLYRFAPEFVDANRGLSSLLFTGMQLNVALAIFNMLPIPPLDGSRVAERLVPYAWRPAWARLTVAAPILLFVIIAGGSRFITAPTAWASHELHSLVWRIANAGLE